MRCSVFLLGLQPLGNSVALVVMARVRDRSPRGNARNAPCGRVFFGEANLVLT